MAQMNTFKFQKKHVVDKILEGMSDCYFSENHLFMRDSFNMPHILSMGMQSSADMDNIKSFGNLCVYHIL